LGSRPQEDVDEDVGDANNDIKVRAFTYGTEYIDNVFAIYQSDDESPMLFSNDVYSDPVTFEDTWYLLNDAHFNIVMVIDEAAQPVERVHYNAYGEPYHHYPADIDGDGGVSSSELTTIQTLADIGSFPADPTTIDELNYIAYADFDRDGDIDGTDYAFANNAGTFGSLGRGTLSAAGPDNIFGYSGYPYYQSGDGHVFDFYLARNRWYHPEFGRWMTRDPVGYVDGGSLYEYVAGNPLIRADAHGNQWHHIIPVQVVNEVLRDMPHSLYKEMIRYGKSNWTRWAPSHRGSHPQYNRVVAQIARDFLSKNGIQSSQMNRAQAQTLYRTILRSSNSTITQHFERWGLRATGAALQNAGHFSSRAAAPGTSLINAGAAGAFLYGANASLILYIGGRTADIGIEIISRYGACCACLADEQISSKSSFKGYRSLVDYWTTDYRGIGTITCARTRSGPHKGLYAGYRKPGLLWGRDEFKWRYCNDN